MVFEVGMKVKVCNGSNEFGWNEKMDTYVGSIATITEVRGNRIFLDIDEHEWTWDANCLETVTGEDFEDLPTLMTKESDFKISDEDRAALISEMEDLLGEYDYETDVDALNMIIDKWEKQKGWMIDLFRKSEFYNGKGQIVIPAKLQRPVDEAAIRCFYNWMYDKYAEILGEENEIKIGLFTYGEYLRAYDETRQIYGHIYYSDMIYKGKTTEEWRREVQRMCDVLNKTNIKYASEGGIHELETCDKTYCVTRKVKDKAYYFSKILRVACGLDGGYDTRNILDGDRLTRINELLVANGFTTKARKGQRVGKFIGALAKETGVSKIVDIRSERWTDDDGNEHECTKDMGWNYRFASLGDAINPLDMDREIVISVNPIDYYTMSFGYNWASCHTIDKDNARDNGSDNYSGCYSGGTESYMLDPSSIIVYVRPTEAEIKRIGEEDMALELQSKLKRCVFYLGEDKLVQSRVYPDGRDGGDEGLAAQIRAIMQKTIAELYNTSNMWTLKKGTSACSAVIRTVANVHYPDYMHYDDCNVSYLKRINGNQNHIKIEVGSKIICPACGYVHDSSEHITCDGCYEGIECYECGGRVDRGDGIVIDGRHYCCAECAENAGYVETVDDGWHNHDYCNFDEYEERWYYDDSEGVWVDGCWYVCSNNAEADGWRYSDIDDDWYCEDDVETLKNGNTFYLPSHDEAIKLDGEWYLSVEDALENGYVVDEETGELVREAA